tara:strand:- start:12216 stop:13445 length:1230 start_codon:yes stop_codon:yes gene_type:complete
MGIQVGKDGELVLTLDDDFNLSTDALRTLGLDTYGAKKNTPGGILKDSNLAPFIFPAGTNNPLKMAMDNLSDKTYNAMLPDVPEPLSDQELKDIELKKLEKELNPSNAIDEFINRTINPMKEFLTEDLMDMIKNPDGMDLLNRLLPDDLREDILKEKNKTMIDGVPGSTDNKDSKSDIKIKEIIEQLIPPTKKKNLSDLEEELKKFNEKNRGKKGDDTTDSGNRDLAKQMEENAKKQTEVKPEKPKSKIEKIMDGLLSKDDFLMDLGLSLMQGEGLFPGVVKAAKAQKAADKSEAASKLQTELAESLIKSRLAPADVLQIAQIEAANVNPDPNSQEYKDALSASIIRQTTKADDDDLSVTDLMTLSLYAGEDLQKIAKDRLSSDTINIPELGGKEQPIISYNQNAAAKS